jgi:hypothetical protein
MEPADLGNGDDSATWLAFDDPWVGTVVVKRLVWPRGVVVGEIRAQDAAEMGLAENDDVIEALAADGADDAFDERILPGCPWSNAHLSNPQAGDVPGEGLAVDGIPIAEHISGSGLLREGLENLAGGPVGRR